MTLDQLLAFAIVMGMMALFVWSLTSRYWPLSWFRCLYGTARIVRQGPLVTSLPTVVAQLPRKADNRTND